MRSTNHGRAGHRPARVPPGSSGAARRAIISGDAPALALLPPWSLAADAFDGACTRCGKCVDACPTHVVKLASRVVRVDFADGECTFCGECVDACPAPAFDVAARAAGGRPWTHAARVDATCLARLGVECDSCGDACEPHAIRFRPRPGATVPEPRIDPQLCNGCGACVRVCPASAIDVRPRLPDGTHA